LPEICPRNRPRPLFTWEIPLCEEKHQSSVALNHVRLNLPLFVMVTFSFHTFVNFSSLRVAYTINDPVSSIFVMRKPSFRRCSVCFFHLIPRSSLPKRRSSSRMTLQGGMNSDGIGLSDFQYMQSSRTLNGRLVSYDYLH
jgi:hypothetical protein